MTDEVFCNELIYRLKWHLCRVFRNELSIILLNKIDQIWIEFEREIKGTASTAFLSDTMTLVEHEERIKTEFSKIIYDANLMVPNAEISDDFSRSFEGLCRLVEAAKKGKSQGNLLTEVRENIKNQFLSDMIWIKKAFKAKYPKKATEPFRQFVESKLQCHQKLFKFLTFGKGNMAEVNSIESFEKQLSRYKKRQLQTLKNSK